MNPDELDWGADGLIPGVVQDARDRRVLMVAFLNYEALATTIETGEVHFWSRSRDELWRKGATSGNTLELVDMRADCDRDALLIEVNPAGPACHTGSATCFSDQDRGAGFAQLEELWATIRSRAAERPAGSYTVSLLDGGVEACAAKVTEEAGEVAAAAREAASGNEDRVAEEAADLIYHLLVLLAERRVAPERVLEALRLRRR